ncbi:MAG: hypothetical protein ABI654_04465 [Betaproteobacteria bacterium]
MTEERDPKVSAAYRDLGAQEPPRALDDAILAAARRAAGARPSALAARASRQRWYAPLATAAVLVLAVATTLNMRLEKPGIESPAHQAPPSAQGPAPVVAEARQKREAEAKPDAVADTRVKDAAKSQSGDEGKNVQRKFKEPSAPAAPEPKPFATDRAAAASPRADEALGAASSVTGKLAGQAEERGARDAIAGARAPQGAEVEALAKRAEEDARPQMQQRQAPVVQSPAPAPAAKPALLERAAALTPEQELERIADLRRQQRHDEADRALAEFRKRYPDYRISEATRERVERR